MQFFTSSTISMLLLYISSFATGGLAFVTNVILAKELGPEKYGYIVVALAAITLASSLAVAGVPHFWLRVFGREGHLAVRWVKVSFYTVFMGCFIVSVLLNAWAYLGPHDLIFQQLIYTLFFPILIGQISFELVIAKFQLEERYGFLALWQLLLNSLRFLWVVIYIVILSGRHDLINLSLGIGACSLVMAIIGFYSLRGMFSGNFALEGHANSKSYTLAKAATINNVLSESYPFALAGFLYVIYFQSDIILLKYLDGAESAGIYNVAFIILGAIYLFPSIFYQRFLLPKLHRWSIHNKTKFLKVYKAGNRIMLLAGVSVMGIMLMIIPTIIPVIFGDAYIEVIALFMILAFCIPCRFVSSSIESVFVDQENMKKKVSCMGITALLNIILNIVTIPLWGSTGAAIATLCSELLLLVLLYWTAQKYVH